MIGLAHELGCHRVIRVLEKKMRLECGVASDLDLIVHSLCDLVRGHIFFGFLSHLERSNIRTRMSLLLFPGGEEFS
jgi:hypothetical protein